MEEYLLLTFVFGTVAMVAYGVSRLIVRGGSARLEQRLSGSVASSAVVAAPKPSSASALLARIGRTAGKPFQPRTRDEESTLRRQLGHAGLYSASAVHLVSGAKALTLVGGLLAGYFLGAQLGYALLGLCLGGIAGMILPSFFLDALISRRREALERALPDAIDLLVVCVDAGLTLDAAMQRVGREINLAHPVLARELAITHMEAQMGLPRGDALRNMSRRTGAPAIQSLTAMLIQAERFGTSIAQALRIHADSLRIKRQYAAEERASKTAVKILFPLVFSIFPAMMIVIGGPAVIKIVGSGIFSR